ncbi:MAG: NAD-dependent epimerase/dehydratase family protein [Deltaproteobacteria bacterium]|nr:MAG: NAD-dependent epimerase/dehydratase family protein [Deltaproteobacteria bacterium]
MLDLVTGSSGLLGSCLVERLRAHGRRVRALDLVPPANGHSADPGVEVVEADLRDRGAVTEACRDVEVVYHLAAGQRMKPQFAALTEREIYAMNVATVEHVVAGALATGVRKLVARTIPSARSAPTGGARSRRSGAAGKPSSGAST